MLAIIQSCIVLAMVCATVGLTLVAFRHIYAMINAGQPEDLSDNWQARAKSVMEMVFGGKRLLDDRAYGWMHFVYLYGFLILGIGHLELVFFGLSKFVEPLGLHPFLYRNFLPVPLIQLYELTQDIFAGLVVLIVAIALYKRLSKTKKRLVPRSLDAELILWFIGALYVTFFLYIGTETHHRMMIQDLPNHWLWYLPFSSLIALSIQSISGIATAIAHQVGFWTHLGIFLGFAAYIPRSKHLHLVAAGPNIYFRHLDAVAKPKRIDFETAEVYGIARVQDYSWKTILDTFACSECGRCNAVCPAHLTGKPLQPKKILHDIKFNLRFKNWDDLLQHRDQWGAVTEEHADAAAAHENKTPLILRDKIDPDTVDEETGRYPSDSQVHLDEMWACTTCAACVEVCPILIDSVPTALIEMRRHLVLTEAQDYPKELNAAFRGLENQQNPWGVGRDKREEWASKLDVPLMKDQGDKQVEYLFWVGCAGSTDDRAKKIQQALVRILKSSGVDFAILGCEEKCTGDSARRMGNEYLFDMLAQENIETLNKYKGKYKKIFATCPHCFNSLKNEYKDYGIELDVFHHTELIRELLKDNRIPLKQKGEIEKITFHDPCYLGRYNGEFDAPRDALAALKGVENIEMEMNKRQSFCCGAGGGRMFMEEDIGKRINHERTDQALKTGADTIATGCPFCMTMLNDGIKDKGKEEQVRVLDLAEIVVERLDEQKLSNNPVV